MINKLFSLAIFFAFCFLPLTARSQDTNNQLLYSPTTADYLAKAYWVFGNLDVNNNDHIDQYLKVTECDLYNQYFKNDIEWSKIRDASRGYIIANKKSFPIRFEFVQPIDLTRYDTATGEFSLDKKSQFIGVSALQVSGNSPYSYPCAASGFDEKVLPLNAILNLSRPLNLTKIDADPAAVSKYLKYLKDNNLNTLDKRPAYIRFRFSVSQSLKPVYVGNDNYANFFGTVESVTVFGDKGLFIKLQEIKY